MNIAIFASAFYPHIGGVEELVRQLSLQYIARGHRPIVITNRWPRNLQEFEDYEGIPVYRLPLRSPDGGLKARVSYPLTHPRIRRQVRQILEARAVAVIHVQCVSSNGHYALLAARDLGIPLVVTSQGERTMDASGVYGRSRWLNRTLRTLLREGDAVTACSSDVLRDLESYSGESFGDRGSVIYNGISISEFDDPTIEPYEHPRPYVLAIGRHVSQKGFDVLLNAVAVARQASDFHHDLLVAGDGPEKSHLKNLCSQLGISDAVSFVGRVDRREAVALFRGCSFFVLPSRHEPFGIVNLEAMAAGKAVVATRVGGVPEYLVDGYNGLLVEPCDAGCLSSALRRLGRDSAVARSLGRAGRDTAQSFDWPVIAETYISLYGRSLGTTSCQ